MKQPGMSLVTEDVIRAHVQEIAVRIDADYPDDTLVLLGVLKGSWMFLTDLARAIKRPVRIDFMSVHRIRRGEELANPGQEALIAKYPESPLDNSHVLVVEDIVDTGVTVRQILAYLETLQLRSVQVATLLDKPARRMVQGLTLKYVGCQIPDVYVVGYGMDFKEDYRSLPDVRILDRCRYKHCVFYTDSAEDFCSEVCERSDFSTQEVELIKEF